MSAYLARLKQIEIEKESHYAPKSEPSKGSEGASEGFEGTHTALFEKKYIATDQWRELESLLAIAAKEYRAPENEIIEMRQLARNNIEDALTCYRDLVRQIKAGG